MTDEPIQGAASSSPFAEPVFAAPAFAGDETETDDDLEDDEDLEDETDDDDDDDEELEDEDEDEDEELEDEDGAAPAAPARAGAGSGNAAAGGKAAAVLTHVARSIVDEPEAVEVEVAEGRGALKLSLHVAPNDMGRIIGKRGRVAQAVRTLVRAAASRDGTDAAVDIVD